MQLHPLSAECDSGVVIALPAADTDFRRGERREERIHLLRPYQVNMRLVHLTGNPNVKFMHCLPGFHDRHTKVGEELKTKLPGEAGQAVDAILKDPNAALKDPGKAIQQGLEGVLAGRKSPTTGTASTAPATTAPSTPKQDATKVIEKGIGDLLKRK